MTLWSSCRRFYLTRPSSGYPLRSRGSGASLQDSASPVSAEALTRIHELETEIEQMRASSSQLEVYAADLQQTYGELRRRISQMQALHRLTVRVSSQLEPDEVLSETLAGLNPLLPHRVSAVYLRHPDGLWATRKFVSGEDTVELPEVAALSEGIIGEALAAEDTISLVSPDSEWLAMPLRTANQTLGVLVLRQNAGSPLSAPDRQVAEMLAAVAAQSLQNAERYRQVAAEAVTDALTGVYNYRHFRQQLPRELARARRLKYQVGLVIADLDHFKQVNDRFGHPEGDRVLRQAADAMQSVMRRTDFLARVGGEEFAMILPACGYADVLSVCDKLREVVAAIAPPEQFGILPFSVTISAGGTATDGHEPPETLIQRADSALLVAKRRGRNCSVVCGDGVIGDLCGLE